MKPHFRNETRGSFFADSPKQNRIRLKNYTAIQTNKKRVVWPGHSELWCLVLKWAHWQEPKISVKTIRKLFSYHGIFLLKNAVLLLTFIQIPFLTPVRTLFFNADSVGVVIIFWLWHVFAASCCWNVFISQILIGNLRDLFRKGAAKTSYALQH